MPKFTLQFTVNGQTQTITRNDSMKIRAGSKNYWFAAFSFADNAFDGLDGLSATFGNEPYELNRGRSKIVPIERAETKSGTLYEAQIPWEVLTRKGNVYVGVFAGDMLVTNEAVVEVTSAAPTMGGASTPSPSWLDRLLRLLGGKQDKLTAGENINISKDNVISATGGGGENEIVNVEYGDTTEGLYNALIADLTGGKTLALHILGVTTTALKASNDALIWTVPYADNIGVWRYTLSSAGAWSAAPEMGVRLDQGTNHGGEYMAVSALTGMVGPTAPDTTPTANSTKLVTSGGVAAALNTKVTKEQGKGLSTNDYTDADKAKVDAIDAEIFDVEYGVTERDDLVDAYNAGKLVRLVYNGTVYLLRDMGDDIATFTAGQVDNIVPTVYFAFANEHWTTQNEENIAASDIVTAISSSSTNSGIPTAKAVYDAIQTSTVIISTNGAVTQALDPNKVYVFTGALTSLTITLNAAATGQLPIYVFRFIQPSTAFDPSLPNTVQLPDGWTWAADTICEVSILDGLAMVKEWEVVSR